MTNTELRDCKYIQKRFQRQLDKAFACTTSSNNSSYLIDDKVTGLVIRTVLKYTGLSARAERNCIDFRLEHNDVYVPDLPSQFNGYRILHLSDLHVGGGVDGEEIMMPLLDTLSCDLAVITGDFCFDNLEGSFEPCLEKLSPIIQSISAHDGIYGVLGNHDLLEMVPDLERMGVRILLNDSTLLIRGTSEIVLAGVDDPHFYECHDLLQAFSKVDINKFIILLTHSPEIVQQASGCGVNLYLCGHTHGGQICLPGGVSLFSNATCRRKYVSGRWQYGGMQGYTSRGAGFSMTPARFCCPPEITLHTLHAERSPAELLDKMDDNGSRWFNITGHAIYA